MHRLLVCDICVIYLLCYKGVGKNRFDFNSKLNWNFKNLQIEFTGAKKLESILCGWDHAEKNQFGSEWGAL